MERVRVYRWKIAWNQVHYAVKLKPARAPKLLNPFLALAVLASVNYIFSGPAAGRKRNNTPLAVKRMVFGQHALHT
jgi:hypothetical protein